MGRGAQRIDPKGRTGFVYFIEAEGQGLVKVGYSLDPSRRLIHLQNASPHRLRLVMTVAGTPELETHYHGMFALERVSGEWFRVEGPVRRLLDTVLVGWSPEDQRSERERELYDALRVERVRRALAS